MISTISWIGIVLGVYLIYHFVYKYAIFAPSTPYNQPRILMYHMIAPHKDRAQFNGLRVSPEMFEKQLHYLFSHGWHSYTMSELIQYRDSLPKKSFVLTFDDGYLDNYTNALPLLKKYHFKATLYLVVNRHNNEWSIHRKKNHNTGELRKEPKLEDPQILEMIESGCFEIGIHTMNHLNFLSLSPEETTYEIKKAKQIVESKFDITCYSFSYPFGLYKEKDWLVVRDAGFTNATTTQKGISKLEVSNLFLLKRITISGKDSFLAFRLKLKRGMKGLKK